MELGKGLEHKCDGTVAPQDLLSPGDLPTTALDTTQPYGSPEHPGMGTSPCPCYPNILLISQRSRLSHFTPFLWLPRCKTTAGDRPVGSAATASAAMPRHCRRSQVWQDPRRGMG